MVFGFTPFVNIRISAHPTYVALYLFTIPTIVFLKLIQSKSLSKKWLFSFVLGLSIAMAFYTNLYYVIMFTILAFIYIIFYFFNNSKHLILIFKENFRYFLFSIISLSIFLIPLVKEAYYIFYLGRADKPTDWNDIIAYSADLTNIFIPHAGNPIYKDFVNFIARNNQYISNIFENFIYPGLIILFSIFAFVFLYKRLPKFLYPIFYTALSFFVLTLGPFLHILGKNTHIPLPYTIIAYLPIIQMARAPGRFIAPFIFLMSIITAFLLQYLFTKIKKKKYLFLLLIFSIFLFDQYIFIHKAPSISYPNNIYKYLENKKNSGALLEIPFSIRDSIKNFGDSSVIWAPYAQLIHNQPIFSAYAGRISNTMFSYYLRNLLIGTIGKIIDPSTDPSTYQNLTEKYNLNFYRDFFEFMKIKYVVLKQNEKYSEFISGLLSSLGFNKVMSDGQYTLWNVTPQITKLPQIEFDSPYEELILGSGWSEKEEGQKGRWIVGRTARIFININSEKYKNLIVEGQAIVRPQVVKVYVNRNLAGKIYFQGNDFSKQEINIGRFLKKDLNTIILQAKYIHKLSKYIPDSKDDRQLSLRVRNISLK